MNEIQRYAFDTLDQLHQENRIEYNEYSAIHDGLNDIETLQDRDEALEELWAQFGDVPMDPETECIEGEFLGWGPGVHREEIWSWFDKRHSKGIHYLLYGMSDGRNVADLKRLDCMCVECESRDCALNSGGVCRFPMVHERLPKITEDDGCTEMAVF